MAERTHAQVGASNRTRGKTTERAVAKYLHEHGLGDGRRNLAGYARDHGDYGPVTDRDGDLWAIEIKGPASQPQPGQVEAWAAEAAREASHAGAPLWVLIVRRPGCADVGRWWAYLPHWANGSLQIANHSRMRCSKAASLRAFHAGDFGHREYDDDLVCLTLRAWVALVASDREAAA